MERFRQVLAVIVWAAQWCPLDPSHARHTGAFFDLLCCETNVLIEQIADFETYGE